MIRGGSRTAPNGGNHDGAMKSADLPKGRRKPSVGPAPKMGLGIGRGHLDGPRNQLPTDQRHRNHAAYSLGTPQTSDCGRVLVLATTLCRVEYQSGHQLRSFLAAEVLESHQVPPGAHIRGNQEGREAPPVTFALGRKRRHLLPLFPTLLKSGHRITAGASLVDLLGLAQALLFVSAAQPVGPAPLPRHVGIYNVQRPETAPVCGRAYWRRQITGLAGLSATSVGRLGTAKESLGGGGVGQPTGAAGSGHGHDRLRPSGG
jgi:hypothetical protein